MHLKIKHQFWLGAGVCLVGILLFVGYVQYSSYKNKSDVKYNYQHVLPVVSLLDHLSSDINIATTSIGFYLITEEKTHLKKYQEKIEYVGVELERAKSFPLMQKEEYQTYLLQIQSLITELRTLDKEIFSLNQNTASNQPALMFARENLNPIAVTMFQVLNDAVHSEAEMEATPTRKAILQTFYEINQSWLNVTNWVRAFLAFRGEITSSEVQKYLNNVMMKVKQAKKWKGDFTLEQEVAIEEIERVVPVYLEYFLKVKQIHSGVNWRKDAGVIRIQYEPKVSALNKIIDDMIAELQNELDNNTQETLGSIELSANVNLVVGLIGIILTILVMFWAKHYLITPLNDAVRAMKIIAHDGNLSHELDVKNKNEFGELADSFNEFVTKIRTVVDLVIESSENLVSESGKLSEVTDKSKEQSQLQEGKIQNVAENFSGITTMLNDVMDKTSDTEKVAREAENVANQGGKVVDITVNQIQELAGNINNAADTMQSLENMSQDIGNIVNIISSITEQTNLLALNAAIEAARAGEAGRGFAVVADEVRSLSNSVTEQTRQIQSQIEAIQTTAGQATNVMRLSQQGAEQCVENALLAGQSLGEIRDVISKVSDNSQSLSSSSSVQIQSAISVNEDLQSIRNIATETVKGAQQTSAVGYEFKILASQLEGLVSQFLLGIQNEESSSAVEQAKSDGKASLQGDVSSSDTDENDIELF